MRIDCHSHCDTPASVRGVADYARRLEIDKVCCSRPVDGKPVSSKKVRDANNQVLAAMRTYPDIILGQCFLDPGDIRFAQEEITRCVVKGGMIGLKFYHQYRMDDPVFHPIIERCIELGIPLLMHAGHNNDPDIMAEQPRLSGAEHFIAPAKLYPEGIFQIGHIAGGGDWLWQIKAMRQTPKNVYMDLGGSVFDAGMIDAAVRDLGAERLLFATDGSTNQAVARIEEADITQRQRDMIWGGNFQRILDMRKV